MVSGLVTSPDDQSRICLLDASPMRIASKSLMSIKLLLYVRWFSQGSCLFLGFLGGGGLGRDLDVGEVVEQLVVLLAHLDLLALVGEDVDVERQGLHLLQQHLEGLGNRRLGDVLALDD